MLSKINLDQLYAWLLPRICIACGLRSNNTLDLCRFCKPLLPWRSNSCYHCGLELKTESEICQKCRDCLPIFNRVCALFNYSSPLPKLISGLKFGKQLYVANVFGVLMAEKIQKQWYKAKTLPEVIVPVPLSRTRLQQRGYNQALEICRSLGKQLQIPVQINICHRIKDSTPQSKLKHHQRVRNLDKAFIVKNVGGYKHVAIVDDVMTTGSTVRAISTVLIAAGVELVDVWCVCRV